MNKLITARKKYTCYNCKEQINKRDKFTIKNITIGKKHDEQFEKQSNGVVALIQNWISYDVKMCIICSV